MKYVTGSTLEPQYVVDLEQGLHGVWVRVNGIPILKIRNDGYLSQREIPAGSQTGLAISHSGKVLFI